MKKVLIIGFVLVALLLTGCATTVNSDSESFLPTIDDFETGWEIPLDEVKNSSLWAEEDQEIARNRGFIEGHYRTFEKGGVSFAQFEQTEAIGFSISLYSKEGIEELLMDTEEEIAKGTREEVQIYDDIEFNEETYEWDDVEKEKTVDVKLSRLKNPQIGDNSIMWSETSEIGIIGEVKIYFLEFTKHNVFVRLRCGSFDVDKSVNNCINYANFVENKIG